MAVVHTHAQKKKKGSKKTWNSPSDAPKQELAAVSAFLLKEFAAAGDDDNTDIYVYQERCTKRFGRAFIGYDWNEWFDEEAHKAGKASADTEKKGKKKRWKKPSDAPKKELAEVSAFLLRELTAAGPDDDTVIHVYHGRCAYRFGQMFGGTAWWGWFGKEINMLAKKAHKDGKAPVDASAATTDEQQLPDRGTYPDPEPDDESDPDRGTYPFQVGDKVSATAHELTNMPAFSSENVPDLVTNPHWLRTSG